MKIIYKEGEGEIEEKKSRFIAHVYPVQSEEQAVSYINEVKKKYWDAVSYTHLTLPTNREV